MPQEYNPASEIRRVFEAASNWDKKTKPVAVIKPAIRAGIIDVESLAKLAGVPKKDFARLYYSSGRDATAVIAKIAEVAGEELAKLDAGKTQAKPAQTAKGPKRRR